MEQLLNKAFEKKYHQSLKYFSHSLRGERRVDFIKKLSEIDVLLASQCVMSSESNQELENYLATKALSNSSAYEGEKKAKGLLSLIELNKYDLIYSALHEATKIDKEYRYAITQVVNELDRDNIIMLLEIILKTRTKALVSSLIASVDNRNVEFSTDQKAKIEGLFPLMLKLYGNDNQRALKFLKVFNLSKKLIPSDIDKIAEKRIRKGAYVFIKEFYAHFSIPFIFSLKQLCEIYLTRNTQNNALAFGQCFFDIEDESIRNELLSKALKAGKYFSAFVLSLIKSPKDQHNAISSSPDVLILKNLIKPFTFVEYPPVNQEVLIEIIRQTFVNKPNIQGQLVKCKITGTIPKTIFVDILPNKVKGTIYVKEFTAKWVDDVGKFVKLGDIVDAVIIGIGEKYVQLSVRRLLPNERNDV